MKKSKNTNKDTSSTHNYNNTRGTIISGDGNVVIEILNKIPKYLIWVIVIGIPLILFYTGGSFSQNKVLIKSNERQETTLQSVHDILKGMSSKHKEQFLKDYFGDDWKKVLENPKTYNNLKIKLEYVKNDTKKLLKEKKELEKKIASQSLSASIKKMVNKAFLELRYDDVRDLLDSYIDSNKDIETNLINAHYLKALSYMQENKYQEAKKEFEQYIPIGINNIDILEDYKNIYLLFTENEKAKNFAQKIVKIKEKLLGTHNLDIADSYYDLASTYSIMEEYEKSLIFQKKALEIKADILGEDNYEVADIYTHIAEQYRDMNDTKEALIFSNKALQINEKDFKKNTDLKIMNYENLARVYLSIGKQKKAIYLYEKSLEISEQKFKKDSSLLVPNYFSIADFYRSIKNYKKALIYYQRILKILNREEKKDENFIAILYVSMANVYSESEEYAKSIKFYEKAIKIIKEIFGEKDLRLITYYDDLVICYLKVGKMEGMEKIWTLYEKILDIDPEVERNAISLINKKEYEKAIEAYRQIFLKHPEHPMMGFIVYEFSRRIGEDFIYKEKKFNKAISLYKQIISTNPNNEMLHISIASAYSFNKEYESAIDSYIKALEIGTSNNEMIISKIITNTLYLGENYLNTKEYQKAIKLYKETIENISKESILYLELFEIQLTQNISFDKEIEEDFLLLAKGEKRLLMIYDMYKILQSISLSEKVDLNIWISKYEDIPFDRDFLKINGWIFNIKDKEIQNRLQNSISFFKRVK